MAHGGSARRSRALRRDSRPPIPAHAPAWLPYSPQSCPAVVSRLPLTCHRATVIVEAAGAISPTRIGELALPVLIWSMPEGRPGGTVVLAQATVNSARSAIAPAPAVLEMSFFTCITGYSFHFTSETCAAFRIAAHGTAREMCKSMSRRRGRWNGESCARSANRWTAVRGLRCAFRGLRSCFLVSFPGYSVVRCWDRLSPSRFNTFAAARVTPLGGWTVERRADRRFESPKPD
jgi:hypothetical protein